ncbi:MAG: hypothetical protein A3G84_03635 [Chloroflexi bacterium RIFCSPLOWO2_12_FULL_71_12]|nr:MAG: hypothetical protein A3G84_03635 [Chloroflexi bacterium RIFCSPLOWO2_12_FULL_71_12]
MRLARGLTLAIALLLVGSACVPPVPSPSPSPTAGSPEPTATPTPTGVAVTDMTAALRAKEIPVADSFDLVRRIEGKDGTPAREFEPVRSAPPDEDVGSVADFWVHDFAAKRNVLITATLRRLTESAKWWVQSGAQVNEADLDRSVQAFQQRIYPTNRRLFGEEWSPGIDADPRINILMTRIPGPAAGYFSSTDGLPRWVNEFSAEREMIYMNLLSVRVGTDYFQSVLAHEFCHMQQFGRRARNAVWFNEGYAQLCERANGFFFGFEDSFLRAPDTQLDAWSELEDAGNHYGAAFLFLEYLRHRTGGGYELMNALTSSGIDTFDDLDRELRRAGHPPVEELFADFVAANALIGSAGAPPKLTYPDDLRLTTPARPSTQDRAVVGTPLRTTVHQQAARYVELPLGGAYRVRFSGPSASRVIPADAHSGRSFWWSDRADGMDATLTREVDLGAVASATLRFWTWFDIEVDFDYGYVAVSTDGGRRWETLAAPATTTDDPNGNNLGNGFTTVSGGGDEPVWIEQRIDLTPYAGKKTLLRFEYVTDGALNDHGFAIDDVEIPEVGYRDDAESETGWESNGFIRSTNTVQQRYVVQVVRFGERPTVDRHAVEDGSLEIVVDATGDRRPPILAVTGFAPRTTESTAFEVLVTAGR